MARRGFSSPVDNNLQRSPAQREFRCTWGNCTKSFSRSEHLARHALNHNEDNGTACDRCSAVFKRKDLLDRHMARHKEKDAEAGGEGLGKLLTRKRLWKDSTGAIIAARRPEHDKKRKVSNIETRVMLEARDPLIETIVQPDPRNFTPLSPPASHEQVHGSEYSATSGSTLGGSADFQPQQSTENHWQNHSPDESSTSLNSGIEAFGFLSNAEWGCQPPQIPLDQAGLQFDDVFGPDTASSFNMPFTTQQHYDFFFPNDLTASYSNFTPASHLSDQSPINSDVHGSRTVSEGYNGSGANSNVFTAPFGRSISSLPIDGSSGFESSPGNMRATNSDEYLPPIARMSSANTSYERRGGSISETSTYIGGLRPPDVFRRLTPTPVDPSLLEPLDSMRSTKKSVRIPYIDEKAREGILHYVDRAQLESFDGVQISREHPLLSIEKLQELCTLFFTRFNQSYPLLHQATFDPASVDPLLLCSVLQLGATYSNQVDHRFALCLHKAMRTQIFGHPAFTTTPKLPLLQTILLVECFGKSRAGQMEHDMSHLFHGLLINLIRRSDCQSARCRMTDRDADLETRWRAEIDAEQRRRLALLCFMWDTQHAVLFSQSLCMNAAELKLTLPWDSNVWDAETAEEWQYMFSVQKPLSQYLAVLKSYTNPGLVPRNPNLNALSRVLMLHGLMSVAWDLKRRDQTSLGIAITKPGETWQTRIADCYDAWKLDFDNFAKEKLLMISEHSQEKAEFSKYVTANTAIYHAAHIILDTEIIDLQIYAGASHIIGRPVMPADRERSRRNIERWAKRSSMPAARATSHAAFLLRDGIRKLEDWDAGDVFHYPWCLYLATLTCWSFQTAGKLEQTAEEKMEDSSNEDDSDWDSKAEMNALVSALTRSKVDELWKIARKYRTGDLPRVMAKHLGSIRWALILEGRVVLKELVGGK